MIWLAAMLGSLVGQTTAAAGAAGGEATIYGVGGAGLFGGIILSKLFDFLKPLVEAGAQRLKKAPPPPNPEKEMESKYESRTLIRATNDMLIQVVETQRQIGALLSEATKTLGEIRTTLAVLLERTGHRE